jgi:hypothetical protein
MLFDDPAGLDNWVQKRQRRGRFDKSLIKGSEGTEELPKANISWVEAVIEKSSGQRAQDYFAELDALDKLQKLRAR